MLGEVHNECVSTHCVRAKPNTIETTIHKTFTNPVSLIYYIIYSAERLKYRKRQAAIYSLIYFVTSVGLNTSLFTANNIGLRILYRKQYVEGRMSPAPSAVGLSRPHSTETSITAVYDQLVLQQRLS